MTERRLHVSELPEAGGDVVLDEAASQHVRVLRLRPGDPVRLFDGTGREADAEVTDDADDVPRSYRRRRTP